VIGSRKEPRSAKRLNSGIFGEASRRFVIGEMEKVSCSSLVNKEGSPEEGKELTIDGHDRGTKESHRHGEKSAEAVGLKGMSKEERDI